ncbi:MAG: hypothetical protein U0T77_00955 [Chitinophagales bacterium]
MQKEAAIQILLDAANYFEHQGAGYKSWGKVEVIQIAIRLHDNEILITDKNIPLAALTTNDIKDGKNHPVFQRIFAKRKNIQVVLLTKQEFASKVKTEIPPILDDQAQLLGVSIRIARTENDILHALCGRYASICADGYNICIGNTIEEAYVAAQLLEKTSRAFIEAEYLGGAKSINKIEAWLMHKFYQLKYSKEAKKNK